MRIGIDISQTQYSGTGVANYVMHLVQALLKEDSHNEYVLFFSSLRGKIFNNQLSIFNQFSNTNFQLKRYYFPLSFIEFLWNRLHIVPIEWLIGEVDIFISSDWCQPPTLKAKKATFVYDLTPLKYSQEMGQKIVETHKRRLDWVKKECDVIFCDSQSAKEDVVSMMGIPENKIHVIYPGL